tara:strand:+ start:274 stop:852 length:579 start_codon:yes stop_codon:yes gene_type:complete
MTSIIIVDKGTSIKATKAKGLTRDTLYKKCGFRKADGFERRNKFTIKKFDVDSVEVWARDTGKAGTENKYELPPPIDQTLYFGNIAIAAFDSDDEFIDLTEDTWKKVYEHLFGGFEDIDNPESEADFSEDELESVPAEQKTKHGYLKDGFVVDAIETDEEEDESEEDEICSDEISVGSELEEEKYYYSDEDE